mgnify:CR=1 FL=1
MAKASRTLTTGQYVTFATTFFLMCILRLPFTLFLLFGFALALTLLTGRKSYCAGFCPLGAVQDYYPPREKPPEKVSPILQKLRIPVFIAFWSYLAFVTYSSFRNPVAMWRSILLLMILSMVSAIILQSLVRKRFWCSKVCPFGKVLDGAVRVRRLRPSRRRAGGNMRGNF